MPNFMKLVLALKRGKKRAAREEMVASRTSIDGIWKGNGRREEDEGREGRGSH